MIKFFILKITLCLSFVLLLSELSLAQQVPLLNQYYINKSVYNPAAIGSEGTLNAYLLRNSKFNSFEGGHITNALNFDIKPDDTSYAVGVNFLNEDIGILNNTQISLVYSYKLKIDDDNSIRLGLSFGIGDYRFNMSELKGDKNDPFFVNKNFKKSEFIGNCGLYYQYKRLNIGIMVPQMMSNNIDFRFNKSINSYRLNRSLMFYSEYTFDIEESKRFTLTPSTMIRLASNAPFQIDINALLEYQKTAWFALTYRSSYALGFNLGYKIFDRLKVGYSHDIPLGRKYSLSSNCSEILIGYTINIAPKKKKYKKVVPSVVNIKNDSVIVHHPKVSAEVENIVPTAKENVNYKALEAEEPEPDNSINELFAVELKVSKVLFENKGYNILSSSEKDIVTLENKMKSNKHFIIRMHAFTDSFDTEKENMTLILKRFVNVQNLLVSAGIEIQRIIRVPHINKNEYSDNRGNKIKLNADAVHFEIFTY